jgi:broad specificity phosphatase PhoE
MLITLIRHSKTKFSKDIPNVLWQLTDEGVELASQLSMQKEIKDIQVLYSSLQTKALQTAIILAKDNQIPIKTNPELTELTSITNGIIEDFEGELKKLYSGEIKNINNGETIEEGKLRFNRAIEVIIKTESRHKNLGIVAHANVLSIFSSQFTDKLPFDIHQKMGMPDIAILDWETKKFIKFYGEKS